MMYRDNESWTDAEDALLGTDTDRKIAVPVGRSSVAVLSRRTKLGIPAYHRFGAKSNQLLPHALSQECEIELRTLALRVHVRFCETIQRVKLAQWLHERASRRSDARAQRW